MKKARLIGIDILKIVCALLIFGRHAVRMGGCHFYLHNYLLDDLIVGMTSIVMSIFFIMSGFTIQYVYGERKILETRNSLVQYYAKRIIALLPMYMFVHVVSSFFYGNSLGDAVRLFPIEILGIQTWYNSLFGFLHNGGTWFVSCLLVAYFIYPLVSQLLSGLHIKWKLFVLVGLICMKIYASYILFYYKLSDTYTSPLFRTIEFIIGVVLCSVASLNEIKKYKWIDLILFFLSSIVLFKGRSIFVGQWSGVNYLFIAILIYSASRLNVVQTDYKNRIINGILKIINYLVELNYPFYILQCILWKPFYALLSRYTFLEENSRRCLLAFGFLFFATIVLHEIYEKPVKKLLGNMINRKEKNYLYNNERKDK